jgi:NADH dehydrogenase
MNSSESPVVILGAGFVGLFTALHLERQKNIAPTLPVILVDRGSHFCFKPLLYEYFTGEMESDQLIPAYQELLADSEIKFVQDTIESIDLDNSQVHLANSGVQPYKYLVLALGCVPAFFAEGAKENALTFQSRADADRLKQHLMDCMEKAIKTEDPEERRKLLTVAVVGGGPAGVELSLTLGDVLPQWYEAIKGHKDDIRIVLLNRGDILQGDVNSLLRDTARKSMEERVVPVELLLGASVTAVPPNAIEFTRDDKPERLEAGTVMWMCGTQVHPLIKALSVPAERRTKRGQLLVNPTLQLLDYPNVFAAGDCAAVLQPDTEAKPLPPTAQVAYQQGAAIANALKTVAQGLEPKPGKVTLRGTLMKLGYGTGVANLFDRYEISGKLGQMIRQLTYIELLPVPGRNLRETGDWLRDAVFLHHAADHHVIGYTAGYEPHELATLARAVMTSGTAVSLAEIGTVSTFLETAALGKELAGAPGKYPNNRVIQALFGHHSRRKEATQKLKDITVTAENALDVAIDQINAAVAVLNKRATPDEIQEFKEFVYSCCDSVAKAAGSGLLGGGPKVSAEESIALEKLKTALSL